MDIDAMLECVCPTCRNTLTNSLFAEVVSNGVIPFATEPVSVELPNGAYEVISQMGGEGGVAETVNWQSKDLVLPVMECDKLTAFKAIQTLKSDGFTVYVKEHNFEKKTTQCEQIKIAAFRPLSHKSQDYVSPNARWH
jgi:hypothetical protein